MKQSAYVIIHPFMTTEQIIAEGRRLQRSCFFLRPEGSGDIAAIWYDWNLQSRKLNSHRPLISLDTRVIPQNSTQMSGFATVFVDEAKCTGGCVEILSSWPKIPGTSLYAHAANILPPIDAVFALGSESIGAWLCENNWTRKERYNENFRAAEIVKPYLELWRREFPIFFDSDIYAAIGGWHLPGQDSDWHDLLDERLMVLTFREAEPWVEVWRMRTGQFKVIQRTT